MSTIKILISTTLVYTQNTDIRNPHNGKVAYYSLWRIEASSRNATHVPRDPLCYWRHLTYNTWHRYQRLITIPIKYKHSLSAMMSYLSVLYTVIFHAKFEWRASNEITSIPCTIPGVFTIYSRTYKIAHNEYGHIVFILRSRVLEKCVQREPAKINYLLATVDF